MKYNIPAILAMIATVVFAVICNAFIEWRWSWIDEWSFAARGMLLWAALGAAVCVIVGRMK